MMMSTAPITIRGDVDQRAVEQLKRCLTESAVAGAIMADGHVGYSAPIGGVMAYAEHISPSGVGFDIACGNKAAKTGLRAEDVDIPGVMDEIARRISFGLRRPTNSEPVDHPVFDEIAHAAFGPLQAMTQAARTQLGTVGSGNHYVDLFADEDGWLWVGVHFGSRGFGHKTATMFLKLAAEEARKEGRKTPGDDMDADPTLISVHSELGEAYIYAMDLAGRYAYAGRDVVVAKVLEILGAESVEEIHNNHNFAWRERHFDRDVWVVRKGATPAAPGQKGFVGATMGEPAVILEGVEHPDMTGLMYSTVHGAGRVMSRTQAAGKTRRFTAWECNDRDCGYRAPRDKQLPGGGRIPCPDHPKGRLLKRHVQEQVRAGAIDYTAVQQELQTRGIELRGGAADEAPGAYKRLDEVLAAQGPTVRVLHTLTPIGVAMAGPGTEDPFRD